MLVRLTSETKHSLKTTEFWAMVSRGLAKSGSRDPYWSDSSDIPGKDGADSALGRAGD